MTQGGLKTIEEWALTEREVVIEVEQQTMRARQTVERDFTFFLCSMQPASDDIFSAVSYVVRQANM